MTTGAALDPLEAIRQERLGLCDYLQTLTPEEWEGESLCQGWTVKDVVAHLTTSTRTTLKDIAVGMVRARGDFDRMEMDRALAIAGRFTPQELTAQIRQTAGSAARAPFSSPLDPLADILIHGQDIARPLGHERPIDPVRAIAALDHVATSRWYGTRERFDGLHVTATDAAWALGTGELTVEGSIADILLVSTGRAVALSGMTGAGAPVLADRLRRP